MDQTGDSSGLLDSIVGFAKQGADVYKTLTGKPAAAPAAAAPAASTSTWTKYLPWIVGGVVLVVVLGVVFGRK